MTDVKNNNTAKENDTKCIDCKKFYHVNGKYCTACNTKNTTPRKEYLKKYCFNKEDLTDIFTDYKNENKITAKFLSKTEFKILVDKCNDKYMYSGYIYMLLLGAIDFPATILTSAQADALLCILSQNISTDKNPEVTNMDNNNLIHSICPFVYDPWNFLSSYNTLLCYYKDFGDLTEMPTFTKNLYSIWDKLAFSGCHLFADYHNISECSICLDQIMISHKPFKCPKCNNFFHSVCLIKYFEKQNKYVCPLCTCKFVTA